MAFLQAAPASGCALVAALAPSLRAAGTLLPGWLWRRAGSAGEAWKGYSVGWEVEAGREAPAEEAGVAVVSSAATVQLAAGARCPAAVSLAPGSAEECQEPGPRGSTST